MHRLSSLVLMPAEFLTPNPHCSVTIRTAKSMLKIGTSKPTTVNRAVQDKLTHLLPKEMNVFQFDGHFRDTQEAKDIQSKILRKLENENSDMTTNKMLSDTFKLTAGTLFGTIVTLSIGCIIYFKCCKKDNENDQVMLHNLRLRPDSMVKLKQD